MNVLCAIEKECLLSSFDITSEEMSISSRYSSGSERVGDDSYDGHSSNDIWGETPNVERLVSNDDVISGGEGRDYIFIGEGFDRNEGGPANDRVHPNDHD